MLMEARGEGSVSPQWKEWEAKVKSFQVPRTELNKVVMEYLVKEGFKDVSADML